MYLGELSTVKYKIITSILNFIFQKYGMVFKNFSLHNFIELELFYFWRVISYAFFGLGCNSTYALSIKTSHVSSTVDKAIFPQRKSQFMQCIIKTCQNLGLRWHTTKNSLVNHDIQKISLMFSFMLDEMAQWNASKYAIYLELRKPT